MYRLLVPVDTDDTRSAEQIETLQTLPFDADLEVHVLHVYEEIDVPGDEAGKSQIDQINESLESLRELPDTAINVIEALEKLNIDPLVHELVDDPADGILSMARDIDADAILLGVRDRTPIGKVVLGSVSQTVIHQSDCPVIVAR